MHPLYQHILNNNNADLSLFKPLHIAGLALGRLHPLIIHALEETPFIRKHEDGFALLPESESVEGRTKTLRAILLHLIEKKLITKDRKELYAVGTDFSAPPVALADRSLMPALGFISHGIHCNAYIKQKGVVKLWTARRSMTSHTDPGKLDHLVAGGQPHGLTLRDNLAKEAFEEAGIPKKLVEPARSTGLIRYNRMQENGVRRDVLFVFDLRLPEDFMPESQDGESGDFRLMALDEVYQALLQGNAFKFNVNLVLIDFLIRRGFIASDEAGYTQLACGLKQGA